MSTPTEGQAPQTTEAPVEGQEADQDQQPGTGKRAARLAAEAAEARATAAEARVTTLQRREVARLAGPVLAQPEDVMSVDLGGAALDDLLDEQGDVDPAAVAQAAAAVAAARPGLAVVRRVGDFDGGVRTPPTSPSSWRSILRRGRS